MGACKSKGNQPKKVQTGTPAKNQKQPKPGTENKDLKPKRKPQQKKSAKVEQSNKDVVNSKASERKKLIDKSKSKVRQDVHSKVKPNSTKFKPSQNDKKPVHQIVTAEEGGIDEEFDFGNIKELGRSIRSKFKEVDKNGDKMISKEEFLDNWENNPIDDLDGAKVFEEMDVNSSGLVSLSEFTNWHHTLVAWAAIVNNFTKKLNRNEQKVSKKEFLEVCKSNSLCTVSDAKALFKKLNVNGTEMLNLAEICDRAEVKYILHTLQESSAAKLRGKKKGGKGKKNKGWDSPAKIRKFYLIYRNGVAKLNVDTNATIMQAFNQIDWQTDRKLSVEEYITYFEKQGVGKPQSEALFNTFNTNEDGFVTFKEFKEYLSTPQWETKSRKTRKNCR